MELKFTECKRDNMCVDCDDPKCIHAGQAIADCPFYYCQRDIDHTEECDTCTFFMEIRKELKNGKGICKL